MRRDSVGGVVFNVDGPRRVAGTQHAIWVLNLPDGSVVIVREESHGLGGCPCQHQPPMGQDIWHYNIEYQKITGPRGNKRAVFNLHMAVWKTGPRTCFSCWNINPKHCVYSDCMDGDEMTRVQNTVREVAQSVLNALQAVAEVGLEVGLALATAIIWILTRPFQGQFA
jgi:hypothetical protein